MEDESYISSQALLALTEKYFLRISPAQWALLAAGVRDPAIDMILADMCGEIVQTVATEVLRLVVPVLVEHLEGRASPDEMSTAIERCTPQLGDSIMTTFAAAADVPEVDFVGAKRFTALIETEANVRMNSVLSSAISSEGQSEPLLYVNATMSSVNTLYEMVCHAHKCLSYLSKMTQRFYKMSGLTPVDMDSATRAVAGILLKWAKEGRDGEDKGNTERSEEAQSTAEEIIQTMVQLQQQSGCTGTSRTSMVSRPCIDMSAILDKVKCFFASQPKPSASTDELVVRSSLNTVRCAQFKKMMAGLKSMFQKSTPPFVVSLPLRTSLDTTRQSTTGKSSQKTSRLSQPLTEEELSSEFNSLTSDLIDRELESRNEDNQQQLTDTVYEHLVAAETDTTKTVRQHSYLNVLYAITDDTIKKYLQQMRLWLKVLRVNAKSRVEVSGALNDIDSLISGMSGGGTGPISSDRPTRSRSMHEAHMRSLVSALIVTLVMRLSWRYRSCTNITAILPAIKRLSERAVVEISPSLASALTDMDAYDAVVQAVAKDLSKEFDSPHQPLMAQDSKFDNAVFKHLKSQIQLLSEGKASKNHFFANVGKVLSRPFLSLFCPATHPLTDLD